MTVIVTSAPSLASRARRPPAPTSRSSGWAPKAITRPGFPSSKIRFIASPLTHDPDGGRSGEQKRAAVGAAVQEEVEEAEVGHEAELRAALRVDRVLEALPVDRDAGPREGGDVEVPGRAAGPREIGAGADLAAEIEDALGLLPGELEGGGQHHRGGDRQPAARQLEDVEVQVEQVGPAALEDLFELVGVAREVRGAPVVDDQAVPDAPLPVLPGVGAAVLDPLVADPVALVAALERHGEPADSVVELDPVAVLEVLRLVLQVVHHHEQIGARQLVEVAEPGQERGLVGGDDHRGVPGTWPRVSQLAVSSVKRPSGVRST